MSGRGRRNIPVDESNPDSNASIAQLLRLLVEQTNRGNGQSSSSRGPNNDDPQEKFRRQKPKEFSGTTDPLVAESWIKSMEVIFEYLQMPDLDRPRCAIYMLRDDAMIWWEGAKLSVMPQIIMKRPAFGCDTSGHLVVQLLGFENHSLVVKQRPVEGFETSRCMTRGIRIERIGNSAEKERPSPINKIEFEILGTRFQTPEFELVKFLGLLETQL
ncbi:hypothetical protein F511_22504 [Dorcoceras hygrometricum]|uniref:Uncharacterized protein n=1 Tax=Dorcoceras hygrometricum TaxID=472368 RepID=A0A2Z7A7X8_9LAMI|nr:hypothetical protein F511_22504 [Dorcoceras hygrometricum]